MNKKVLMGGFIAFVMIFSVFGFVADFAVSSKLKYGDYKFKYVNNQFSTKINSKPYSFFYFPKDLESVQSSDEVDMLLAQPVLTVTYNPKSSSASEFAEVQYYIEEQLKDVRSIERAVTDNEGLSLPKKNCSDATPAQPVLLLQKGNSSIVAENNCVIVSAFDGRDMLKLSERLIYDILGVMP